MTLGYGKSTVVINCRHTDYLNCRSINSVAMNVCRWSISKKSVLSIAVDTTAPTRYPTVAVHVAQLTYIDGFFTTGGIHALVFSGIECGLWSFRWQLHSLV